jgi:Leucine-rich repeat (LRR) protein
VYTRSPGQVPRFEFLLTTMSFEMENLVLPTEYSLGRITVYRPQDVDPSALLEARGTVRVPRDATLILDLSQELCNDLSRIRLVPPRLLESGIHVMEKNLENTDFREIPPLRPSCIAVGSCAGIRVEQIHQLGNLSSLEHLSLSNTPLDIACFQWLSEFPNLKTLVLNGAGAAGDCVQYLSSLKQLEQLDLANCMLTDSEVRGIWRIPTLRGVNLRGNKISDKALEQIGDCSGIQSLHLDDSLVSDKGIEIVVESALRSGQQISGLSLRSCRITDKALVRLTALKGLRLVTLWDTDVTPDGASFLKGLLPNCIIFIEREKGGGPRLRKTRRP